MATFVVGHRVLDLDCVVSMLALKAVLEEVKGYHGRVRFEFVPKGAFFHEVEGDPNRAYVIWEDGQGREHRIYYVDCCGSLLDHHREGCRAESSAELVDYIFKLVQNLPEWERLVKWATAADTDQLRCGCSLDSIIRGLYRADPEISDWEVFCHARRSVEALLANERFRVAAEQLPIAFVDRLVVPVDLGTPSITVAEVPGFGRIALVIAGREMGRALVSRLKISDVGNCRVIVSFNTEEDKTAVIVGNRVMYQERLCLVKLGIVATIRAAEAQVRGIIFSDGQLSQMGKLDEMPVWFAHEVGKKVVNLLNGSAKADLEPMWVTLIPRWKIVEIVWDCVKYYAEYGSAVRDSPTQ